VELRPGIRLLEQKEGEGAPAKRGDRVVYNVKIFLNKGDEVPFNERQAAHLPAAMIRSVDDYRFIASGRPPSAVAFAGAKNNRAAMTPAGFISKAWRERRSPGKCRPLTERTKVITRHRPTLNLEP